MSQKIAFTGHRKISSDLSETALKALIVEKLDGGANEFYCGMAYGFDLLCCQILAELKENYTFKIVACIPFQEQAKSFSKKDKILYDKMLAVCDEKVILSKEYHAGCYQARDRFIVDNAEEIIAYLNKAKTGTAYTVNYAIEKGKKICYVV